MKRRTMITALSVGDTCEMDLLLLKVTQRMTKTKGNPFVELVLTDGASIITARKFSTRTEELEAEGVMPEMVVRVAMTVDLYMEMCNYYNVV